MRISCPYCGERSNAEFTYLGDAALVRPQDQRRQAGPAVAGSAGSAADEAVLRDFTDYVYFRNNPPGPLREWWQHTGGCRAWLVVERNVSTHEIGAVSAAGPAHGGTREMSR